jgi:hypothetical protein
MLEGHFFGAANIEQLYPMEKENTEEEQLMLVLKGIAEQTDMTIDQIVPYCEWNEQDGDSLPVRLQTHTTGLELETEDLISIGVDILSGMTLELDEPTENDTETETPVVEVESTDEVETTNEENEHDNRLATEIYLFLEGHKKNYATERVITKGTGIDALEVNRLVILLSEQDMVHKINKTVYWGPAPVAEETAEPEMVEVVEIETVVAEDEPLAEKTNNAVEHALNTHFDSIRNLFNKVESNAEADSGYKSQAEQYTEVMTDLRALLDEVQREQGWLLGNPVWQRVAHIAEWQPEA